DEALQGWFGEGKLKGKGIALLKPTTFMNLSGQAASATMQRLSLGNTSVLCAVDEIQLDTGRLKLSSGGSDGGHNGLTSMIAELGDNDFRRMRLGVGPYRKEEAPDGLKGFVLSKFRADEAELLKATLELGCQVLEEWMVEGADDAGFVKATSFGNAKSRQPKELLEKSPEPQSEPEPKPATEGLPQGAPEVAERQIAHVPYESKGLAIWQTLKALFGAKRK
ncbi:MAG: aminoacyl-tRNA hydrolase, partial [Planctomycetes bacterium]|nr:aminoacyl-tRNA hydrolase [Planctomycetota bacterium]